VRSTVRDGGGFQEAAAYSRAVRIGNHVAVSGTAPLDGSELLHRGDAHGQAGVAIEKALAAAAELGATPADVIRTRLLLAQGCDWEGAIRAHREAFAGVEPANTSYFVGGFIPEGVLVEFELDAVVAEVPR
jgi:enamine deaminase RidA (YjgF/YER057c/UK114 family)